MVYGMYMCVFVVCLYGRVGNKFGLGGGGEGGQGAWAKQYVYYAI